MNLAVARSTLEKAGVTFAPGLAASEIDRAEEAYALVFPPDLRELLMFALPVSPGWPDWRVLDDVRIRAQLRAPYEGICFDIEHNAFWLDAWGTKPTVLAEAFAVAKKEVDAAPTLIPIRGHRYLPSRPNRAGNPVFSVHQTDIIHYGADLWNYLENEFHGAFETPEYSLTQLLRHIELWSDLAS
jgi:hypothetical protein